MIFSAMIHCCKGHTSSFINPAIAITNHFLAKMVFKGDSVHDDVRGVYLLGALIGTILAGLFSWAHRWFVFKMEAGVSKYACWDFCLQFDPEEEDDETLHLAIANHKETNDKKKSEPISSDL